jgi:hypothetical protein
MIEIHQWKMFFVILFVKNELFERVLNNSVRIEGHGQVAVHDKSEAEVEMKTNNIIRLILDCEARKIFMINE